MRNFREYQIWQKAIELGVEVFKLTNQFPKEQKYILAGQMQRAAISISSNIAEGCSRSTEADFARFLHIAIGSSYELESQLILAGKLNYISEKEASFVFSELELLQKQINSLVSKLRGNKGNDLNTGGSVGSAEAND